MSTLVLRCDLRVLGDANSIAGSLFTFHVVVFDRTRSRHHPQSLSCPCTAHNNLSDAIAFSDDHADAHITHSRGRGPFSLIWLRHSRTRNIVSLYVAQLIGHSFSSSLSVILIRSLAKSSSEVSRLHCLCLSLFSPLLRSSSISSSSSSMVVWTLGCLNPRRHFYVCVRGLHCTERDEGLGGRGSEMNRWRIGCL